MPTIGLKLGPAPHRSGDPPRENVPRQCIAELKNGPVAAPMNAGTTPVPAWVGPSAVAPSPGCDMRPHPADPVPKGLRWRLRRAPTARLQTEADTMIVAAADLPNSLQSPAKAIASPVRHCPQP